MKTLDEAMNKALEAFVNRPTPKFYRFQVFTQGTEKKNTVGMAYLKEGHSFYTLRLWTFLEDKFFLLPNKEDSSKFILMTREPNKSPSSKNKYFWSIIGNAKADSSKGVIELNFDLFEKKIYMSMFPELSATPYGQPIPDAALNDA